MVVNTCLLVTFKYKLYLLQMSYFLGKFYIICDDVHYKVLLIELTSE